MALVDLDGGYLAVGLSLPERLVTRSRDLRIPLGAIEGIRAVADPWPELRGRRTQGFSILGRFAMAAYSDSDGGLVDLVLAHRGRPSLVVELGGVPFDRLVITCPFPDHTTVAVRGRLPRLT